MDLMYCRDSEEPNSWPFESLKADGFVKNFVTTRGGN